MKQKLTSVSIAQSADKKGLTIKILSPKKNLLPRQIEVIKNQIKESISVKKISSSISLRGDRLEYQITSRKEINNNEIDEIKKIIFSDL